ncbi:class I SAM-dependent methyltransferase [Nocardia brasiliensis]|uniref:class I SAM-dependent methyltransferase n=1 Tax=Nocardia brasiliensis TaxID=37326 RepID=UPI002457BA95|nr:class I SAM-dependent methyltransferase [Nocardia brasiliensis]
MTRIQRTFDMILAGQLIKPHGILSRPIAWGMNKRNRAIITAAVNATNAEPGDVVVDVGFGGGSGISLLLDLIGAYGVVHGVDLSWDMVARARSRFRSEIADGRVTLTHGPLGLLPFDDQSVDAAICIHTLYFVSDLHAACAELVRIIRPRGRLIVGIGDPDSMADMPHTLYGFNLHTVSDISLTLEDAGCTVHHEYSSDGPIPYWLIIAEPLA